MYADSQLEGPALDAAIAVIRQQALKEGLTLETHTTLDNALALLQCQGPVFTTEAIEC